MGVSRQNIFGAAPAPLPAEPGSYGEAPDVFRLPDSTRLGPVKLQVADLARSLDFYQQTLGLKLLERSAKAAVLGPDGPGVRTLVKLHERPGAKPARNRGRTGLYHFAILLPDRQSLGSFIHHLSDTDIRVGSADHLVSEALYLQDPDNLGIEVYADRPRSSWKRVGRELMMASDPLDIHGLLAAAEGRPWSGMPAGTVMGHLHLHVGDTAAGSAFYSAALGFDRTVWHYPGALFFGAGGYHHHLGTNTWAGTGASAPSEDEAQLLEWTIRLPDESAALAAQASLERAGFPVGRQDGSFVARDPWATPVRVTAAEG